MLIQTSRFGEIEVEENQIISLPSGLVGFSEDRRFVIREDDAAAPFLWLQAVDNNANPPLGRALALAKGNL